MESNDIVNRRIGLTFLLVGCIIAPFGVYLIYRFVKRWFKNTSYRFWEVKPRELPPACLTDPALGNHVHVQIKNVKLHYVEKGDKSKPLMLFLHGFPEFWYSWRNQIKEFSSDYWVVAVDMRGYGDSEKPIGVDKYHMDHLIADVKNLIIALGREKCTLVAHDWGGIIAWYFVLLEPQMIDSYVIMNSGHPIALRNALSKSLAQVKMSWYVFFFQLPWLPERMCGLDDMSLIRKNLRGGRKGRSPVTDQDIEAFKFTFGKTGAFTFPINYYRSNFMLGDCLKLADRGRSKDLPPGLILFGDKDLYINREIQEETMRLVNNSTLVCVEGANHFVQQDDPVAVNREMRQFLGSLKSKRS